MFGLLRRFCAPLVFCCFVIAAAAQERRQDETRQAQPLVTQPATDGHGDPIPEGAKLRLGSSRFRFGGNVATAALSPDGKLLAVGTGADFIILADASTGKESNKLRVPGGYGVQTLIFAPDGKALAVMGYGPGIRLVEIPSGKEIAQLKNEQPNTRAMSLAFSGDAKTVSASMENFNQNKFHVHVWEAASGKELSKVEVIQNNQIKSALSADGATLATWGFYSPRGNEMVANNPMPDNGRTIQLWNVKDGKEKSKIKVDRPSIAQVAFAPDGKTFAVASGVATYHIFDSQSGKELRKFAGRRGQITHLAYSSDGQTLVSGSMEGTVQSWEAKTGKRLGLSDGGPSLRLFSLAFAKDGKILALSNEGQALHLRDAMSGKSITGEEGHHYWVRSLAFTPDGKTLISAGADGKICWWDSASGKQTKSMTIRDEGYSPYGNYNYPSRVGGTSAISRDAKYLATGNDYGLNTIRLWDLDTGKAICDFDASRNSGQSSFAFSPDGGRLAALGNSGVLLWDVASGQELPTLPFQRDPKKNNNMNDFNNSNGGSLVFSPDGKRLAAAHGYYERTTGQQISEVYLWQVEGAKEIRKIDKAYYNLGSLAFSPDGETLAIPMQDKTILLVKATTGREVGRLDAGNNTSFQTLVFSPDGRALAGALNNVVYFSGAVGMVQPTQSYRVAVWELASGQMRQEFGGHQNSIATLAYSPDGKTLASGSFDTTIMLWDLTGAAKAKGTTPSAEEFEKIWAELAQKDAKTPFQHGIVRLLTAPELSLEFLKKNMSPAKAATATPAELEQMVADLDAERFVVREKATKALVQLGPMAAEALKKVLQSQPNLEQQRRIEILLEKLEKTSLTSDELRSARAVEVLEKIGTPGARAVLANLAEGAPHARITQDAKAALQRLGAN